METNNKPCTCGAPHQCLPWMDQSEPRQCTVCQVSCGVVSNATWIIAKQRCRRCRSASKPPEVAKPTPDGSIEWCKNCGKAPSEWRGGWCRICTAND